MSGTVDPTGDAGPTVTLPLTTLLKYLQDQQNNSVMQALGLVQTMLGQVSSTLGQHGLRLTNMDNALASLPGIAFAGRSAAASLAEIKIKEAQMSQTAQQQFQSIMDTMAADMAAQTTVANGQAVFIAGISSQLTQVREQLAAAGVSPDDLAKLQAIETGIKTNTATLTAATASGTAADAEAAAPPAPVSDPANTPEPVPPPADPTAGGTVDPATGLPTT